MKEIPFRSWINIDKNGHRVLIDKCEEFNCRFNILSEVTPGSETNTVAGDKTVQTANVVNCAASLYGLQPRLDRTGTGGGTCDTVKLISDS